MKDVGTEFFRKAFNTIFIYNPTGTSLGVLLGVFGHGVIGFLSPTLSKLAAVDVSKLKIWHMVGLGAFLTNIGPALRKSKIDPALLEAIDHIDRQRKEGMIQDWQARQMFMQYNQKILESVTLDRQTDKTRKGLEDALNSSSSDE